MRSKKQQRLHRAIANASDMLISLSVPGGAHQLRSASNTAKQRGRDDYAGLIRSQVGTAAIRYEDERWIVTELGFVLMAVLPSHAVRVADALVVPGVDDQNQRGYLVLRTGLVPYHSLAAGPVQAERQARTAAERAARLVEHFGSREALREAARSAPWYLMSSASDVHRSGLCSWGVDSWLGRIGMGQLAYRTGLPRLFVRMAGGYGDRITAMTMMRRELVARTADIPSGLPIGPAATTRKPVPADGDNTRAEPASFEQHTARVSQI